MKEKIMMIVKEIEWVEGCRGGEKEDDDTHQTPTTRSPAPLHHHYKYKTPSTTKIDREFTERTNGSNKEKAKEDKHRNNNEEGKKYTHLQMEKEDEYLRLLPKEVTAPGPTRSPSRDLFAVPASPPDDGRFRPWSYHPLHDEGVSLYFEGLTEAEHRLDINASQLSEACTVVPHCA